MALDDPTQDPNSNFKQTLFYLDAVITSIYACEAIFKILAYGFVSKKCSYIRDPWNMVDFSSLCISV